MSMSGLFLRCAAARDAPDIATLILDVILDCRVVPAQSDNEFANLAFDEVCNLRAPPTSFPLPSAPNLRELLSAVVGISEISLLY
jgi:hypothetical protein